MTKTRWLTLALPVAALAGLAVSQEPERIDPAKMLELMVKYSTPGEHHKDMAKYLGDWDYESRLWMTADAQPTVSKGTATTRWLIEGMWVETEMKGMMMGRPYHGVTISGFDLFKKKHVGCTVHNMSTAMLTSEGVVVDPTGKLDVSYGTLDEYLTGEHDKPVKYVTRHIDDDHYSLEIHDLGVGLDGMKVMEFRFARRK
jgi:hypothetical protein